MIWRIVKVVFVIAFLLGLAYPGQADFASDEQLQEPDIRIISSSSEQIVIEVSVPDYQIKQVVIDDQTYDRVYVPGHSQTTEVGKPQVPVIGTLLGIPLTGDFNLEILSIESEVLKDRYLLAPAPRPVLAEDEFAAGEWQYTKDQTAYLTDHAYPNEVAGVGDEAWMRDQRLLRVVFYPFQYQARIGVLSWNTKIRVALRFAGAVELSSNRLQSTRRDDNNPFDSVLASNLLNYVQAREWRGINISPELISDKIDGQLSSSDICAGQNGPKLKIPIIDDGIYRIDWRQLIISGVDPDINPKCFHLQSQGQEVAIYIHNTEGDDNAFNSDEYIMFFGEKFSGERLADLYSDEDAQWLSYDRQLPDGTLVVWSPQFNATMVEKYTNENVYWLTIEETEGKRMYSMTPVDGDPSVAQSYPTTVNAEESHWWKTTTFTGEDTWFWDRSATSNLGITNTFTVSLDHPNTSPHDVEISGELISFWGYNPVYTNNTLKLYINDSETLGVPIFEKDDWNIRSRLHFTATVAQNDVVDGINGLTVVVSSPVNYYPEIFFDWFAIEYQRDFVAVEKQIMYSMDSAGPRKYEITGFTNQDDIAVIDITDSITPQILDDSDMVWESDMLVYQLDHPAYARFFAAKVQDLLLEDDFFIYTPQSDFSQEAEYVIITPDKFWTGANDLKDYRHLNGLTSGAYDIEDIYDEFNYGIYHPIAIKNFIRYAYENWSIKPSYVVLIGDGHWNFKGYTNSAPNIKYGGYDAASIYMPPYLSWVDPWQGETDSTNLLAAIAGDDPIPDVMISRIPVNSEAELTAILDKIESYEATKFESWQDSSIFIADNTDAAGNFSYFAEGIIQDYLIDGYRPIRIFQEDYDCISYGDPSCTEVTNSITNTLNVDGALLMNYIGHGALWRWSSEQIFVDEDIGNLTNADKMPVMLSMTCWDGYFMYPGWEGLVEQMLRAENKGAVAAFSPTGLGVASGHDHLHRGFYDALIYQGENTLGPLTQAAKLRLYQTGANYDLLHTFTIFGDPALKIPITRRVYLPAIEK